MTEKDACVRLLDMFPEFAHLPEKATVSSTDAQHLRNDLLLCGNAYVQLRARAKHDPTHQRVSPYTVKGAARHG